MWGWHREGHAGIDWWALCQVLWSAVRSYHDRYVWYGSTQWCPLESTVHRFTSPVYLWAHTATAPPAPVTVIGNITSFQLFLVFTDTLSQSASFTPFFLLPTPSYFPASCTQHFPSPMGIVRVPSYGTSWPLADATSPHAVFINHCTKILKEGFQGSRKLPYPTKAGVYIYGNFGEVPSWKKINSLNKNKDKQS